MQLKKNTTLRYLPLLALALALTAAAYGKTGNNSFPNIHIRNFGQMNDRFYRGARPRDSDFNDLKTLGINTVIDLRNDADGSERQSVEAVGMHYVNIPMSDSEYPKPAQIDTFLKLVDDPATGKFFVHCEGGRHRTGVMGAVYRFTHDGWNYDQAYAEMKSYDFYTRWGHGAMKQFVQDYWQQMQNAQAAKAKAPGTAVSATQK